MHIVKFATQMAATAAPFIIVIVVVIIIIIIVIMLGLFSKIISHLYDLSLSFICLS